MAGSLVDGLENSVLDHVFRNTTYTPDATVYVGLTTTIPSDSSGGTEVTGGSYARQACGFAAASGGSISNSGTITFPTASANWGTVVGFEIWSASSAGTRRAWGELLGPRKVFTCNSSTDVFTSTSHGLTDGTSVEVEVVDGALPSGLSDNTEYFIIASTANTFQLSATSGGSAINVTTDGNGAMYVQVRYKKAVNSGDTAKFTAGQLAISLD
jgi:hypothetical protein